MLTEYQEIKIELMKRANWLNKNNLNPKFDLFIDDEQEKGITYYSNNEEIKNLEEARDKLLINYNIDEAIELQYKINELYKNIVTED